MWQIVSRSEPVQCTDKLRGPTVDKSTLVPPRRYQVHQNDLKCTKSVGGCQMVQNLVFWGLAFELLATDPANLLKAYQKKSF